LLRAGSSELGLSQSGHWDSSQGCGGGFGGIWFQGLVDHFFLVGLEADSAGISYGYVQRSQDQIGSLIVDRVAQDGVDDFHQCDLDGLLVFEKGDGVNARVLRRGNSVKHALVEVAEPGSPKSGRAATYSCDLHVSTDFDVWIESHQIETSHKNRIPFS
jgi:hypothetical protein